MEEVSGAEVFLKEDLQSIGVNPRSLSFSNFPKFNTQGSVQNDRDILSGQPSPTCQVPSKYAGFVFKSRKWPMKGWHKRFFVLENGILTYAKTPMDIDRGKWHGQMDVGMSVIACKSRGQRIDLDADYIIYHLKLKSAREYEELTLALRQHRLYRLATMSNRSQLASHDLLDNNNFDDFPDTEDLPIIDLNKELKQIQLLLFDLNNILNQMQSMTSLQTSTAGSALKKEKSNGKFHLGKTGRKDKKTKDCLMIPEEDNVLKKSSSIPNLSIEPDSIATNTLNITANQQQFYTNSKIMYEKIKKVYKAILLSKQGHPQQGAYVQSLKQTLAEMAKQNMEYRTRLSRIHDESSGQATAFSKNKPNTISPTIPHLNMMLKRASLKSESSRDSQSNIFYDATDRLDGSSEGSEDDDVLLDDASDCDIKNPIENDENMRAKMRPLMRRRSRLPAPVTDTDIGLFGLLRKNIGKDLSKVSMPVAMNEPLNALQRLCEELEYSELLDRAAELNDPVDRMIYVTLFAVSSYSSTFTRAGHKPFNPLLGETYECIREDKGWKFVAEQTRHHPPISACFCESNNFLLWQDMQVKTKFWGKSMEVQPIGEVHLRFIKHNEEYTWNKATSCIHNILGGERWVEHYGQVTITNHTKALISQLDFTKSGYWSSKKHEVIGHIKKIDSDEVIHHIYGQWNESMHLGQTESAKCLWRPGALPVDHDLYYGFTKFAMELNEIDPLQRDLYPPTDTRFRPDQRLIEMGRLDEAEIEKQRIEQQQREMRKQGADDESHTPMWFTRKQGQDKEFYEYNGQYWNKRKSPGFQTMQFRKLW